jgi:hypothetical protein
VRITCDMNDPDMEECTELCMDPSIGSAVGVVSARVLVVDTLRALMDIWLNCNSCNTSIMMCSMIKCPYSCNTHTQQLHVLIP